MPLSLIIPDPDTLKNNPAVLTRPLPDNDVTAQAGSGKDAPKVLTRPLKVPFPDEPDKALSRPIPGNTESDATFQPVKDFTDYTKENYKAGQDAQSSPYLTIRLLGTLGAATAPVGGAAHAVISKPLERATGIPASQSDAALMFTPAGVGTAAGMAGRAAKAIPAIGKGVDVLKNNPVSKGISNAAQEIFSPTTLSKEGGQAEGIVREERGLAERSTEQAKAKLDPDYEYLSTLPAQDQLAFINRIETASKSKPLADPRMEKAANNMRGIYQTVKNDLAADSNFDQMGFVQDYFPHMWQDPKKAQNFIQGWAKTGSGKNVQKRSIPTIEDGIKAGLVPKSTNPAEMTMQYIGNMYNYKALKGIQSSMADQGLRKFYQRGKQPAGWVELKGPGNKNIVPTKQHPFEQVAYAPEDAGRIYNRYYSPGFTGHTGEAIRGLRKVANVGTQMALGLSAYHYRLLANESTAAAFSKGSVKGIGEGTPYLGAGRHYKKGELVEKEYLEGQKGTSQLDHKIIDYMTRAGGRMKGVDKAMDMSAQGDYWRAWKNGSLKAAAKADAMNLKAGGPIKVIMKTMASVSQPLFMKTVPRIKNAVNYEAIADWVKAHPTASEDEILKASRDIIDSTDNRFGEMIQDNLFWDKRLKETTQLMLLSVGWSMGTARETVGGAKDLADFVSGKSKELSQRGWYVLAAPISHMLHAATYQYLKTGQSPQDLQDLVYPRTGGTSPYHDMPEREALPGQMKDVINYQKHPMQELGNKMAPIWRTVYQMANNEDWRGDPIAYKYQQNAPGWLRGYAEAIVDAFAPISIKGAVQPAMKGSNIGPVGRFMGDRPAGMAGEDPEGYAAMQRAMQQKAEKKGVRHMQLDEQRRQQ